MIRITLVLISFIFIFFTHPLNAKNLEVNYSVEFGILGEIAKVHATLTTTSKVYTIDAKVLSVGVIAKAVTNNLEERHISKGHRVNDLLVTDMYQMIKSYGEYTSTTIYRVDHKKKRVTRQYIQWRKSKEIVNEKVTLGYYSRDDMMTLFLNLSKHLKNKDTNKTYRFKAVGADRKNGRVDVTIPTENLLKQIKSLVGEGKSGEWYSRVVMHRKLYHSKKGELAVKMNRESILEKAVLKDLIFFGDVRIIRQ